MSIISVKNVNKFFGDGVQVLKDVSFEVEQGEVLGIIVLLALENRLFFVLLPSL